MVNATLERRLAVLEKRLAALEARADDWRSNEPKSRAAKQKIEWDELKWVRVSLILEEEHARMDRALDTIRRYSETCRKRIVEMLNARAALADSGDAAGAASCLRALADDLAEHHDKETAARSGRNA